MNPILLQHCKKIEDVVVPVNGTGKYLEVKTNGFHMNPSNVPFYYAIRKEVVQDQNGETVVFPGETVLDGNLYMDRSTYDQWGSDDDYVWNWVATQLGLTFITA